MTQAIHYAGIRETSDRMRARTLSPVRVVSASLQRIAQLNPRLNAFITVLEDQALAQAQLAESELAAGRWRGALHGIPIGIKDFFDTAGVKTTAASKRFGDRVPANDAVAVADL